MKKNMIIWDWNGTLLDDVDLCVEAINMLLARESLPLLTGKEEYQRVFQFPIRAYYEAVGFDFSKCPFDVLAHDYMEYYQPRSLSCSLHEHAETTLHYFYEKGYEQVLLSASRRDFLLNQCRRYPILPYFKDVLGLDDIYAQSKAALAQHYFAKEADHMASVVFFGDSVHDYEVAQSVNADCVLIANGHEHKDKLIATGGRVIDRIDELPKIINN